MPKNPHPTRGGQSSKKSITASANSTENATTAGSSKKGSTSLKANSSSKPLEASLKLQGSKESAAEKGSENSAQDVQKKPDTRTLIGGASWTGKLPVNLLSEHCQKQKWNKPEYNMTR